MEGETRCLLNATALHPIDVVLLYLLFLHSTRTYKITNMFLPRIVNITWHSLYENNVTTMWYSLYNINNVNIKYSGKYFYRLKSNYKEGEQVYSVENDKYNDSPPYMCIAKIENVLLSDLFKIPNIVKRQLQNKQNV
mgnify:CR=1 FL=1